MQIGIVLPQNRLDPGQLSVSDDAGSSIFGPVPCLGRADSTDATLHRNPTRNPALPFGDTPTGTYSVVQLVDHGSSETDVHTYGTHPSVLLNPLSGQALTAKQQGRTGLMIHGGSPSFTGGLRPTHGCVRLSEDDQGSLIALIVPPVVLLSISVSVTEAG
jgi:hypothetical protein